jgi:hypothetical protein
MGAPAQARRSDVDTLAARQFALLRRMAALEPAPCFIGGYAEDALLAGRVTRAHGDLDWLCPRHELELRLAQAGGLGFEDFETWGESGPGEPFYLFGQNGDLKLEIGVADETAAGVHLRIWRLAFDIGGREAPAGYRLRLPDDTFRHPRCQLDGVTIRTVSPLALYQFRIGIARQGSFGEPSARQRATSERLREAFFPERSPAELEPPVDRLD